MERHRFVKFLGIPIYAGCAALAIIRREPAWMLIGAPWLAYLLWLRKHSASGLSLLRLLYVSITYVLAVALVIVYCAATQASSTASPPNARCPYGATTCATSTKIEIFDLAGTTTETLALAPALYTQPSWSPDGSELALVKDNQHLVLVDLSTSAQRTLTSVTGNGMVSYPAWSPDGNSIAYALIPATDPAGPPASPGIQVLDVDGGAPRMLEAGTLPSWSPDGDWIAASENGRIVLVHPDGRERHDIGVKGVASTWAPDGTKLAVDTEQLSIFKVNATGRHPVTLTAHGEFPVWLPDGRVAFAFGANSVLHLQIMAADGSGSRQISAVSIDSFCVSPDGSEFAVAILPTL